MHQRRREGHRRVNVHHREGRAGGQPSGSGVGGERDGDNRGTRGSRANAGPKRHAGRGYAASRASEHRRVAGARIGSDILAGEHAGARVEKHRGHKTACRGQPDAARSSGRAGPRQLGALRHQRDAIRRAHVGNDEAAAGCAQPTRTRKRCSDHRLGAVDAGRAGRNQRRPAGGAEGDVQILRPRRCQRQQRRLRHVAPRAVVVLRKSGNVRGLQLGGERQGGGGDERRRSQLRKRGAAADAHACEDVRHQLGDGSRLRGG